MPAFFSRVFSRGKDKEKGKDGLKEPGSPTGKQSKRASRASAHSLLEGKFEAVSPSVSPSVERYEEKEHAARKEKEKERLGLFRPKSRTTPGADAARKQEDVPQLTLDLNLSSGLKGDSKKRDLSIVYEGDFILDDEVLGEKRLSPAEALKLIRACLPVLTSRGVLCPIHDSYLALLSNSYRLFRSRLGDVGRHASALAFCVTGYATQNHFALYFLPRRRLG